MRHLILIGILFCLLYLMSSKSSRRLGRSEDTSRSNGSKRLVSKALVFYVREACSTCDLKGPSVESVTWSDIIINLNPSTARTQIMSWSLHNRRTLDSVREKETLPEKSYRRILVWQARPKKLESK